MKVKPDLSFWKLWNISFGFFGVQIAYALQSANISRIFSTLGADPHSLSYFWILPPLAGIIVQPIVGAASDRTWTRFGRRIPYLFIGSLVAVLVMCLLPNAGSFGMAVSTAMIFGLVSLMFLDTSINMAMQPFKMMVGDMVNEKQKGLAYSIQSFLCNAGSLVGYLFPFIFAWVGISNTAPQGVIPDSVIYSFYIGAAILIFCVIYTTVKVKEMPPAEYAEYHGITEEQEHEKVNMLKLLVKAPKAFWTVGLVQFFCWFAFMFMWTYTNGSIAANVFDAPTVENTVFTDMLRTTPFPCEPIYQDTMLAVLPEGHPLGENIFIQVDELAAEPFILLEEGRGGGCIRDLLTRHPQINVQYRVADDYTILNLVENNLGVSILPEAVLRRSGRRVIARRLSPELQRTVGVVYKQKTGLSTAGQMFLSELKASIPNVHG